MPIYEYEPEDRECLMCDGRIEVMQSINEEALKICPACGLEVKRCISRASFKMEGSLTADKAAKGGFATFKRSEKGVYEKVAGEGPDMIVDEAKRVE